MLIVVDDVVDVVSLTTKDLVFLFYYDAIFPARNYTTMIPVRSLGFE